MGMKGVRLGTKTITMYVSDIDRSEIPEGEAYQLSIRHPDGSTQQLDISAHNPRARASSVNPLQRPPKPATAGPPARRSGSAVASRVRPPGPRRPPGAAPT